MFHAINSNTVAFTALDRGQQASIWISFFEAPDSGCAGHHPLYAAGDYVCEAALASQLVVVEMNELVLAAELDEPSPF